MMAGLPRRSGCSPAAVATLAYLLLLTSLSSTQANDSDGQSTQQLQQRVAGLEAEVDALKQKLAQLLGATPVVQDLAGAATQAGQPFLPQTANTMRTIAVRSSLWPQFFSFQAAVSAGAPIIATALLYERAGHPSGRPVYAVTGDAGGRLSFFSPQGHLVHEYDAGGGVAVTALASVLLRHNASQLAVGLADGTLKLLLLGHESVRAADGSGIVSVAQVLASTPAARAAQVNSSTPEAHVQPLRHLVFTKNVQRRLLVVVDGSGQVLLLSPGSGRVLLLQQTQATPLAVSLNTDFQLVIQSPSAAVVVLMHRGRSRVLRPCTGLAPPAATSATSTHSPSGPAAVQQQQQQQAAAGDVLVAAAWDPYRQHRVYGLTAAGELVALMVPAGARATMCKVIQRVPLGLPPGRVSLVTLRGRLVLLHSDGLAAFNITHPLKLAGSQIASHTWADLWGMYGLQQHWQQQRQQQQQQQQQGEEETQQQPGREEGEPAGFQAVLSPAVGPDGAQLLPAAACNSLLLLPLGSSAAAAFVPAGGGWLGGAGGGGGGAAADGGSGAGNGAPVDWVKALQPAVVVMMVVVGVWQFMRASSGASVRRAAAAARSRGGSDFGEGFEGLSPSDLGQLGLFGSRGLEGLGSRGLDLDFGEYAGRRGGGSGSGSREAGGGGGGDRLAFDGSYAGLSAAGARRRARAIMFGRDRGGGASSGGGGGGGGVMRGLAGREQQQGGAGGRAAAAAASGRPGVLRTSSSRGQQPGPEEVYLRGDAAAAAVGEDGDEGAATSAAEALEAVVGAGDSSRLAAGGDGLQGGHCVRFSGLPADAGLSAAVEGSSGTTAAGSPAAVGVDDDGGDDIGRVPQGSGRVSSDGAREQQRAGLGATDGDDGDGGSIDEEGAQELLVPLAGCDAAVADGGGD